MFSISQSLNAFKDIEIFYSLTYFIYCIIVFLGHTGEGLMVMKLSLTKSTGHPAPWDRVIGSHSLPHTFKYEVWIFLKWNLCSHNAFPECFQISARHVFARGQLYSCWVWVQIQKEQVKHVLPFGNLYKYWTKRFDTNTKMLNGMSQYTRDLQEESGFVDKIRIWLF